MTFDANMFAKRLNTDSQLAARFKTDPKAVLMEQGLKIDEAAASDIREGLKAMPVPTSGDKIIYPISVPIPVK
jgi:hypothetical protein